MPLRYNKAKRKTQCFPGFQGVSSDLMGALFFAPIFRNQCTMELVKQELTESGVHPSQFIPINFEDMRYSHLQTAKALHDEITARAPKMDGKVYPFF